MQLHTQLLFRGKICQRLPKRVVTGVFGMDTRIDLDTAVVVAVPLLD